ncbi:DUF512 domain-containing protein [Thermohalobacter berrensis]|uniref:Fe-S oxidoreductase n=1 Tax=Thermohalobacter berrensis TaxID=99594 RepID=A0A419TA18_9FIRM|nr:DUF512 domain-containing protein [Thermohalobacter berrensis]RKD34321.1 Fe-S oxidoreductase [Thermohalobacter berrensis]
MEIKYCKQNKNIIENIQKGSIAEEMGIEKGDILISIDGQEVKDILDYKYLIADDYIEVTIQKKDGEIWQLEIEKDFNEDIGIEFTNPLIDKAKSCKNKCVFCFIDQLPKGLRKTLYFKDDDSRLSFLHGNFITLTNMSNEEIERIIKYKLSPINISVHTTDPDLRIKMLNNKRAGNIYEILKRFSDAGIKMNCQIVLCPGINDGEHLEKTINDLSSLYPNINSVAVVPVGITKYREGLFELTPYNKKLSKELLNYIHHKQKEYMNKLNTRFVFAADEFYVQANKKIPSYEEYEGFPQYENGVGLMRLFYDEVKIALKKLNKKIVKDKSYIVVTGTLAYKFMCDIANMIMDEISGLNIKVLPIENHFFGETITVSGLIAGRDLINKLSKYEIKDGIIIPKTMLKRDEDIFLDDITIDDLRKELKCNVLVSDVDGEDFINKLIEER